MPALSLGPAGRAMAIGLVVAVPASALLTACGAGEEERYGEAFTDVAQPLTVELVDLGNAVGSANTREQVSAALGRADAALATAASGFEDLDPPNDDVAAAQADLIAAVDDFEGTVEETREALRSGSDREVQEALQGFSAVSRSFAVTLGQIGRDLEDAGVPLGDPEAPGSS